MRRLRNAILAAVILSPLSLLFVHAPPALAQVTDAGSAECWPGDANAEPRTWPYVHVRVHTTQSGYGIEGASWHWHCWTGTRWATRGRMIHAQDYQSVLGAVADARMRQWIDAKTQADRAQLAAEWDKASEAGFCDRMIANAGYAAALCTAARAAMASTVPSYTPAQVRWVVAPNQGLPDRPTRYWPYQYTSTGAVRTAPERAPVGSECNPQVGAAGWFGVLGRTDRVALCQKQTQ